MFSKKNIKLIAMDLDGTLTQHKSPLSDETRAALDTLSQKYKLLIVGAGDVMRIFNQLGKYPIDIIGNYGMQYGEYDKNSGELNIIIDVKESCNRSSIDERVSYFRRKYNYENYKGESVEYHTSGCITFPILGTSAEQEDKLSFDPDRKKRRKIYAEVEEKFPEYCVFVGGSSSFDMAPKPYNKYYALSLYCEKFGITHSEVVYIGDDYGEGGNDEAVYKSDFNYIMIDDYRDFSKRIQVLL